jgi:hypothetical protein
VFQKTDSPDNHATQSYNSQACALCRLANDRGGVIDDGPRWVVSGSYDRISQLLDHGTNVNAPVPLGYAPWQSGAEDIPFHGSRMSMGVCTCTS